MVFLICIELIFALLNSTVIEMYSFPFVSFTYGPLLFLYVSFMTNPDKKFNWLSLFHFIPFASFLPYQSFSVNATAEGSEELFCTRQVHGTQNRLQYNNVPVSDRLQHTCICSDKEAPGQSQDLVSYTSGIITLNWLKILAISFI